MPEQPDTILAKQVKGLRKMMRPLKARGKEWVHGLNSGSAGSLTTMVYGHGIVSRLGRPGNNFPQGAGGSVTEDVDSDGSDLVRKKVARRQRKCREALERRFPRIKRRQLYIISDTCLLGDSHRALSSSRRRYGDVIYHYIPVRVVRFSTIIPCAHHLVSELIHKFLNLNGDHPESGFFARETCETSTWQCSMITPSPPRRRGDSQNNQQQIALLPRIGGVILCRFPDPLTRPTTNTRNEVFCDRRRL